MAAKIDINALKIYKKNQKQMRLKIGKKLKTANCNSKFTDLRKRSVPRFVHFWKFTTPNVTITVYVSLPTSNFKGVLRHLKNCSMEKAVFISHWSKNIIKFCRSLTKYYQSRNLQAQNILKHGP